MELHSADTIQTITTTALPTITGHFASSTGYTWIGSAYLLATSASTPSWGALSNIWGRKPALLSALAIFFLGSLLAALSTSMSMLIAGRAIQGTGGGGLLILVNICTGDLFSVRTRGLVYGIESLVWAAAAGLGPVIGGVCAEIWCWRWCFWITCWFLVRVREKRLIRCSALLRNGVYRPRFVSSHGLAFNTPR